MRNGSHHYKLIALLSLVFFAVGAANSAFAQSTAFTYQGRLQDGGGNANGSYDIQFTLWDSLTGGTQQPQSSPVTVTKTSVAVANGVFTVQLDFGASTFPGADRFLEIGIRPTAGSAFTVLSPRQSISSTPYAIRALNSTAADGLSNACNSCVQSTQINSVAGVKVVGIVASATDATNATQLGGVPASNYVLTSDSRLSDSRPPAPGSSNYIQNTTAAQPSSNFNISGTGNVLNLTAGGVVSATTISAGAGGVNAAGSSIFNSEVSIGGIHAVQPSTPNAKLSITSARFEEGIRIFGSDRGAANQAYITFYDSDGALSGYVGDAGAGDPNIYLNSTVADVIINFGLLTASASGKVGIGTTSPSFKLHVNGETRTDTLSIGNYVANNGGPALCANTSNNRVALCTSSLRYKDNVQTFRGGLDMIQRLRPISFTWKEGGIKDIGLAAEEVNRVEPLLAFRNPKGEIEGVRYNQLSAVFINAFKEQKALIEQQQVQLNQQAEQLKRQEAEARKQRATSVAQQQELDALRSLVCRSHRPATVCR